MSAESVSRNLLGVWIFRKLESIEGVRRWVKAYWPSVRTLVVGFAFLYRINVEERALVQALGDRYRGYIKQTKRLIPLVY